MAPETDNNFRTRLIYISAMLFVLGLAYLVLDKYGAIEFLENPSAVKLWIQQQGAIGPLIIIGLMIIAITMSPIPSAPIALAAGAIYGHTIGTLYIVIGSVIGSSTAFYIARISGIDVTRKWADNSAWKAFVGSQNTLMGIVFISRLLPFISFDMVSYAAGVTALSFWRFAIATLAGIIPASFLLAHFGSELSSTENKRIGITILILGVIPILIFVIKRYFSHQNKHLPEKK